jgi:hypothetical protein
MFCWCYLLSCASTDLGPVSPFSPERQTVCFSEMGGVRRSINTCLYDNTFTVELVWFTSKVNSRGLEIEFWSSSYFIHAELCFYSSEINNTGF